MNDYQIQITETQANNIVDFFVSNGCNDIIIKEGCLQDNYCLDIGENNYKIGRIKIRKYLIITEKYLNEWSSYLELIMTDNENIYNKYYNLMV